MSIDTSRKVIRELQMIPSEFSLLGFNEFQHGAAGARPFLGWRSPYART